MLTHFLTSRIIAELPFVPNAGQNELIIKLADFLTSRADNNTFLLCGYAGTGKTSIMAALVKALNKLEQPTILLAPTGRAAKVLSAYSGYPAYTIHKQIYRQKSMGEDSFSISYNNTQNTVFIVDEASMISNSIGENSTFGTGRLLDDLIQYVFSGHNCSLIFIGDSAQLPPVGQENSPALDTEWLQGYNITLTTHALTQVARQALESGILNNATMLREQIQSDNVYIKPTFNTTPFTDIKQISGAEMIDEIERAYREIGVADTMIITRTNRRMNLYNQGIRARVLWKEDLLTGSDRVMVTKNNYFWTQQYDNLDFLANGDIFEVIRIRKERELYGYKFADASLRSVDYDWEIDVVVWLDTLTTNSPDESYQMQRKLFEKIAEDYPEIKSKKEMVKKIIESPYYNALQIKHAYAVTCHKAQGGQWSRVFIDQGNISQEQLGTDYYRWLYTALTRAKEQVFLINF